MAEKITKARLIVDSHSATEWANSPHILKDRELGYDSTSKRFKMGNGVSLFKDLPWFDNYDEITTIDYSPLAFDTSAIVDENWQLPPNIASETAPILGQGSLGQLVLK